MGRTLAIGDVHGGLKALIQLLDRINISSSDKLVFLGDYVDGWSDSANTVTFLMELAKQNTCVFLRGNHDDLTEKWLKTGEFNEQWLQHGGQSSIDAYRKFDSEEIKGHLNFYSQMVNYYIDQNNKLFVHAGFTDLNGPEKEYHQNTLFWDRTLWELCLALDKDLPKDHDCYPKRLLQFKEIYIGHTPVTRIGMDQPVNIANVWNVDTGAAFKGKISAIEVSTKEIWQSDPVYGLYQGEEGRN